MAEELTSTQTGTGDNTGSEKTFTREEVDIIWPFVTVLEYVLLNCTTFFLLTCVSI